MVYFSRIQIIQITSKQNPLGLKQNKGIDNYLLYENCINKISPKIELGIYRMSVMYNSNSKA